MRIISNNGKESRISAVFPKDRESFRGKDALFYAQGRVFRALDDVPAGSVMVKVTGCEECGHKTKERPSVFVRSDRRPVDLIDTWRGKAAFLMLNGPSLAKVPFEWLKAPGIVTMGVNNGAHVSRPDLWCAVDPPVKFMNSIWDDPKITKFVPLGSLNAKTPDDTPVAGKPNLFAFPSHVQFKSKDWLKEPTVNWGNSAERGGGRSVMLASIKILYLLGFRRVYLLGCDFHMTGERPYFFDEQKEAPGVRGNNSSYALMEGYFERLKPYFDASGFEVFNATSGSALEVFPQIRLMEALERERIDCSGDTFGMYKKK